MKNNTKNSLLTLAILAISSSAFGWSSPEVAMVLDVGGPDSHNNHTFTLDRYDVPTGQSLGNVSLGSINYRSESIALESSTIVDLLLNGQQLNRYDWTNGNLVSSTFYSTLVPGFASNIVSMSGQAYLMENESDGEHIVRLNSDGTTSNIGAAITVANNTIGTDGVNHIVSLDASDTITNYKISGLTSTSVFNIADPIKATAVSITPNGSIALSGYIFGSGPVGILGTIDQTTGTSYTNNTGSLTDDFAATGHGDEVLGIGYSSNSGGGASSNVYLTDINGISGIRNMDLNLGSTINVGGLVVYAAPEPKSFILMGMGLIGLVALKRRRA